MRRAPFIHKRGSEIDEEIESCNEDSPVAYHEGRKNAIDWVRGADSGFHGNDEIREKMEEKRQDANQNRMEEEFEGYERALGMYEELQWVLKVDDVTVEDGQAVYRIGNDTFSPSPA